MKKTLIILLLLFGVTPFLYADISLSTYYPAPYGTYDRLRLMPRQTIVGTGCTSANYGTLYIEAPDQFRVCQSDGTTTGGAWLLVPTFLRREPDTAGNNLVYFFNTPNPLFGVGTETPTDTLHIVSPSGRGVSLQSGSEQLRIRDSSNGILLENSTNGAIEFTGASGSVTLNISPGPSATDGRVGIATTLPTHTLDVRGHVRITAPEANTDVWIQGGAGGPGPGSSRNLAVMGQNGTLFLNVNNDYGNGTQIGGPVTISGDTTVFGNVTGDKVFGAVYQ